MGLGPTENMPLISGSNFLEQLPLSLVQIPRYDATDFVVTSSNTLPYNYLLSWPEWPSRGGIIVGPRYSGKTHLAHLWALRAKAVFLNAENLEALEHDLEVGEGQAFILDNVETFLPHYETLFFHLFNLIQSKKGFLLLTASVHPKDWPIALKDLISRLATLPLFTLQAPDDLLFLSILAKNFSDYQMQVSPKVLEFIMKNVPRTFENIHEIPRVLNTASLSQHHAVTIPFVKEVLGEFFLR